MAENEGGFDPTLKKKKKKKKVAGLDDDDLEPKTDAAPVEPVPEPAPVPVVEAAPTKVAPSAADDGDLNFDLKKKKKKKKFEPLEDEAAPEEKEPPAAAASAASEDTGADTPAAAEGEAAGDDGDDGLIFAADADAALPAKKKKKKKPKGLEEGDDDAVQQENDAPVEAAESGDHGYAYDILLSRIFSIMKQKNPEMASGEKRHIVLKPPQVHRLGTRRTAFANFTEYCKMLHRPPDHLQNFLIAELGASGSVDGSSALVIRGRFQQKQIENVLRRYIREYVTCHTCKSPDTSLAKENRLFFLQCESCGSRCSVASIRAGFQAVTGKRAAMRAKTEA